MGAEAQEEIGGVANGWRTIETAPKDGTNVLACGVWYGEISGLAEGDIGPFVAYYLDGRSDAEGDGWWCIDGGDAYSSWCRATHWQPLPAPPTPRAQDKEA